MKKGGFFEREVSKSLGLCKDAYGSHFFYRRILDPHAVGMRVPADFMAVYKGACYLFECKSCGIKTSFPLSYVRPGQVEDLSEASDSGCKSIVLIKRTGRPAKVYSMDIRVFLDMKMDSRKKSIKWGELEDYEGVESLRKIGDCWDLKGLFIQQNQDLSYL